MSASSKKKLRKEQNAAAMTEKQRKQQQEAKKLKAYTWTFVIAMVLVVAIVVGVALRSPVESLVNKNTHAVTIGTHELTIPEFSYFYVDEINSYYTNLYYYYGSYAQYFLGFSTGKSLNEQVYDKTTGKTWAKHFMEEAAESAQTVFGLYDLAVKSNHTMSEDERKTMESTMTSLETSAKNNGYSNTGDYLKSVYGNGANMKTYKNYCEISAIASSYYAAHSDELKDSYKDETFRKFEEDKVGHYYSYSYLLHEIKVSDYLGEGTKGEDGKVTYTDEQKAAALAAAKADVEKLLGYTITDEESFNKALAEVFKKETTDTKKDSAETKDSTTTDDKKEEVKLPTCTVGDAVLYKNMADTLQDWVTGENLELNKLTSLEIKTELPHEHKDGEEHSDDEEVEYEVTGFFVVIMQEVNKNDMKLVNVRHILINIEQLASSATQAEKDAVDATAKVAAENILDKWLKGEKTAESFGELANTHSKDTGSNTNGGLYEDVYPGWAVKEFNDWCFDPDRMVGDTGIVKTENGYHVMYLEGYGDYTYRDYMIMNDKLSEDLEAWLEDILEATPYVEVDLSRMNWDLAFG